MTLNFDIRVAASRLALGALLLSACGPEDSFPVDQLSSELRVGRTNSKTSWSGWGGTVQVANLSRTYNTNDALHGLEAGERSDDPCYMKALFDDLEGNASSDRTFNECSGSVRSRESALLPAGYFAVGVQTCVNGSRTKLKGARLIGKPLSCLEDPQSSINMRVCELVKINGIEYRLCNNRDVPCSDPRVERSATFARTNCSQWYPERRCPDGRIATGLDVHWRHGGGSREMADGLRLTCNTVY